MHEYKMNSSKIIFVCGASRSGTTLMARILDNSPKCIKLDEIHFFDELSIDLTAIVSDDHARWLIGELYSRYKYGYFPSRQKKTSPTNNFSSVPEYEIFGQFVEIVSSETNSEFVVEQTPANIRYIDSIRSLYSNVKFVVMVRDPRDVLLSQKLKWKRKFKGGKGIPFKEAVRSFLNYDPLFTSYLWRKQYKNLCTKQEDVQVVKYEKLIQQPAVEVCYLCEFLGIPYDKRLLNVRAIGSSTRNDQQKIGFVSDNANKWKKGLNRFEIAICEFVVSSVAEKFGYKKEMDLFFNLIFGMIFYGFYFFVKSPFVLYMNRHRVRGVLKGLG